MSRTDTETPMRLDVAASGPRLGRRAARCSQADIARAVRAVAQSGAPMAIEIDQDGTIRIIPAPAPVKKSHKAEPLADINL